MTELYTDPVTGLSFRIPPPRDTGEPPDWLDQLAIIIPAYNEEHGIGPALIELRRVCPCADIVVVDDGSDDRTADVARGIDQVRVIRHIRNRGYGAALKTGMRHTTREYVAWYDADGQHRPEDLIAVVRPVAERRADACIGVRGRDSARQRRRAPARLMLNAVIRIVSREPIPDVNSGLRCFRREVVNRYLHLLPDRFSASTTSTLMLLKRGYRVAYEPIVALPRVGKSTIKVFSDGLYTLQLVMRIIVLFEALKVFTTLGAAMIVPGLVYGLAIALTRGQGFPTLAGTLVISGVLTFFMGIVADQVVELRKERFEEDYAPIDRSRRSTDRVGRRGDRDVIPTTPVVSASSNERN
jgi:glycosyltransferase involved in cell wall biosynthesis